MAACSLCEIKVDAVTAELMKDCIAIAFVSMPHAMMMKLSIARTARGTHDRLMRPKANFAHYVTHCHFLYTGNCFYLETP